MEPESYKLITTPIQIKVIRVKEEFDVEEQVIPFEHQTVQNESLPKGQTLLIQPGSNGSQQITYRLVMEDGVQKSRSVFQVSVVKDPVPEITMVGVQTPFTPLSIPGRIAYLIAGNAWVMDGSTGSRRPVVTTGDLDGSIFNLYPRMAAGFSLPVKHQRIAKISILSTLSILPMKVKHRSTWG